MDRYWTGMSSWLGLLPIFFPAFVRFLLFLQREKAPSGGKDKQFRGQDGKCCTYYLIQTAFLSHEFQAYSLILTQAYAFPYQERTTSQTYWFDLYFTVSGVSKSFTKWVTYIPNIVFRTCLVENER